MNRRARFLPSSLPCALLLTWGCTPVDTAPPAAVAFADTWRYSADAPPVRATQGMVVTTDAYASRVGVDVLRAGGNAVDAAVATQFALAVVNPEAGNIGGGGFLVLRMADGTEAALDFREKAPLAATRDMFLDAAGNVTDRSVLGHLASGVPGSVAGMWEAHQRFGTLLWADLVQPAIDLANGVEMTERMWASLDSQEEALARVPATAAAFLPGGAPPAVGDTFRQPDLARTLTRIREHGPDGFYRGETADLLVAEMERGGGLITHADLEDYDAVWRDPVRFTYRGHTVLSMPPPSSGGVTVAEIANMLELYDLGGLGWESAERIHLYAEAARRAFSDRNALLADPDFVDVPVTRLTSREYAAERGATIDRTRATPSAEVGPGLEVAESESTTHYSVVDAAGNAVAVTTTINSWYGSMVTVPGAGFVLNNEMDDFTAKPGVPNQFGLVQGSANAIEPGKRMLSAMTPTIVLAPNGALRLVLGSPGGSTIITTVFQVLSNVLDHGMNVAQAVNAPRVHHQHLPDRIQVEYGGLHPDVIAALEALGHDVQVREPGPPDAYFAGGLSGDVQAIAVGPSGELTGFSDRRRGGRAVGW